ncbi:unknown [Acidaminococcus intestini CAG:325]|nr:unknown [Acidaminococcus intestini CAG:325]
MELIAVTHKGWCRLADFLKECLKVQHPRNGILDGLEFFRIKKAANTGTFHQSGNIGNPP